MADWQRKINIKDVWGSEDIHLIARTAADRLEALRPFNDKYFDDERDELVYDLRGIANDPAATKDDFNEVWAHVYDWGDTLFDSSAWPHKKLCWIGTF